MTIVEVLKQYPNISYYLKLNTANNISGNLHNGQSTRLFLLKSIDQLVSAFTEVTEADRKTQK